MISTASPLQSIITEAYKQGEMLDFARVVLVLMQSGLDARDAISQIRDAGVSRGLIPKPGEDEWACKNCGVITKHDPIDNPHHVCKPCADRAYAQRVRDERRG
jgi:hypothetical protein